MAEVRGIPLLSGPPPHVEAGDACRKCNKEFNVFLSRSRKCNHCGRCCYSCGVWGRFRSVVCGLAGYSYCHNCTDYQALMPRNGQETGYSSMNVCAFCIEYLTITASGKGQLKTVPLSKLKKYIDAYNIRTRRAVEKDDLVEEIMKARGNNGCLPRENEDYYRKHSVPNRASGTQHRGIFSRNAQTPPAPPPPPAPRPPARQPSYNFPRPDLEPDVPPTQQQQSYQQGHQSQYHHQYPPHPPPRPQAQPPPPVPPRTQPQPQYHHGFPPQPPRPQYPPGAPPPPPPHSRPYQHPPPRSTSSQASRPPPPPARPRTDSTAPPPTLDQLLDMPESSVSSLSISTLKSILFTNHVNAGLILEKSDLVAKVKGLVDDERRERARQRAIEEEEERERIETQREMLAEHERAMREREEQAEAERESIAERERAEREGEDGESTDDMEGVEPAASTSSSPSRPPPLRAKGFERSGLCVICQDDDANIAIVDCGHLAMCRDCSELVMKSSRECPLCRTRIVTEARLLRIFKA